MPTDPVNIDVNEVMRQIQERARRSVENGASGHRNLDPLAGPAQLARLRFSASELREALRRVSDLPPSPPTLRGRAGLFLIRIMRRAFAWRTAQMRPFQAALVNTIDEQLRVVESLALIVEKQSKTVESMRRELAAHHAWQLQESERLSGLLAEESRGRREFEAACRSSLNHLEHEILRRST
ncbi:MAG TPA: hypothetical protein VHD76_03255 [Bryobacteraceae bacterium]|jgi:hypothetical protein|nr:hypothetical protein [Bryobacteraceae bacterium]